MACLHCSWLHPPCHPRRPGPLSSPYPCAVFDAVDPELHRDVEAVQEVASKNQRVHGSVHSMDPTLGRKSFKSPSEQLGEDKVSQACPY